MSKPHLPYPLPQKTIIRLLCVCLVLITFIAGYYRARWVLTIKEYNLIEDKYVRVRQILGRERTQAIIDESYRLE